MSFLYFWDSNFTLSQIAYYYSGDHKVFTDFLPLSFQSAAYFRYCIVSISLLRIVICFFIIFILSFYSLNRFIIAILKSLLIATLLSFLNLFLLTSPSLDYGSCFPVSFHILWF